MKKVFYAAIVVDDEKYDGSMADAIEEALPPRQGPAHRGPRER